MKIYIRDDEAYPVLHLDEFDPEYNKDSLEVDDLTLQKWRQVFADFNLVQEEINRKLRKQNDMISKKNRTWDGDNLPKNSYI